MLPGTRKRPGWRIYSIVGVSTMNRLPFGVYRWSLTGIVDNVGRRNVDSSYKRLGSYPGLESALIF